MDFKETNIEFVEGEIRATISTHRKRYINRLQKYAEEYPGEVEIVHTNKDGSILAHFPVSWIKISPPRKVNMSEEERRKTGERLRGSRKG